MLEEYKDCRQALREVYVILNNTNLNDVSKIPIEVLQFVEDNQDTEYQPEIDFEKPIEEQNLKAETLNFLSYLYLKYWCDTKEKKEQYERILKENEERYQKELRQKYHQDDMFSRRNNKVRPEHGIETDLPIAIEKNNIFKRIAKWFKNIFG